MLVAITIEPVTDFSYLGRNVHNSNTGLVDRNIAQLICNPDAGFKVLRHVISVSVTPNPHPQTVLPALILE